MSKYGYSDIRHVPLFLINGQEPPGNVKYGYTEDTEQLVRSQRNAEGVVVSEKVGSRLLKFNNLEWPVMTLQEYMWLQRQIDLFYCDLTYFDAREGGVVTKKFYWGDFSAEPFEFFRLDNVLRPTKYKNVKVNLIDCGEGARPANSGDYSGGGSSYIPPFGEGDNMGNR